MLIECTIESNFCSINLDIIVRYLISWWWNAETRRKFFNRHSRCWSFFILCADVLAIIAPNRAQFSVIPLRLKFSLGLWDWRISCNVIIVTARFLLIKLIRLLAITIVYAICKHICFIIIIMVYLAWDFKTLSFRFLGNICTLYSFLMFCEIKLWLHQQRGACQRIFLYWFIYVWLYVEIHLLLVRAVQMPRRLLLEGCRCKTIQYSCGSDIVNECRLLNSQFWGRLVTNHWRHVITGCWIRRCHFFSIAWQLLLMKHTLAVQRPSEYILTMDIWKVSVLI